MYIRHSNENDIADMLRIYAYARDFMVKNGNPRQWAQKKWPPEELLHNDIAENNSYVCVQSGKVVGTFYFIQGEDIDPTYRVIEGGKWLDDSAYGVVHRLAGDGSVKGMGECCLNWAYEQCRHLRVDTHGDNKVLQNLLKKLGFVHCGTIYVVQDNDPRLAYEKSEIAHR